jgi:hypothetical protein
VVDRGVPFSRARDPRKITGVILTDAARFTVDDIDALVVASFACPYCLCTPSHATFNLDEPNGSAVLCRCDECHRSWVVAVNVGQAMRLAIAPPEGLELEPA